nr:MAG TPA: hypothetical protein [Caudoviricetes sp.]
MQDYNNIRGHECQYLEIKKFLEHRNLPSQIPLGS